MNKFSGALDRYFKITEHGSNIKTEIMAGITTFMTMAYILMVNAGMFSLPFGPTEGNVLGVSYGAMYIVTALSAIVGTLLMAFLAKIPFAQAPGMGLNAFMVYTVCLGHYHMSYANALVVVLASGILFTILTIGGIREKIVKAVPLCVRYAIPAGIGLFIAFIGLQNAHIIVANPSTLVQLVSLNILNGKFETLWPIFITFLTVLAIAVLSKKNVKGAILWGILGGTILYYIGALCFGYNTMIKGQIKFENPLTAFKDFGTQAFGVVFYKGFEGLFSDFGSVLNFLALLLSFAMVDMFDTIGTLLGTARRSNMLDENGELPNMRKALLCDAVATCTGAIFGTSTVTTFVESSAGVSVGGRTGLTALIVAICFFIAMFLSPIAQLIPSCATSAALIYVGVLMMACVLDIDWHDPAVAVPAFLTVIMMVLTYNISYGIGFGFISYVIIKLVTGKVKEIHPVTAILAVLFLVNFMFVTH